MTGWPRSVLISAIIALLFLSACGVKGPPVNPSGPWGPVEETPGENNRSDQQAD